ncbi:MAG: hypothetical protein PVJ86_08830 [Phycisphaerales bacterium]
MDQAFLTNGQLFGKQPPAGPSHGSGGFSGEPEDAPDGYGEPGVSVC